MHIYLSQVCETIVTTSADKIGAMLSLAASRTDKPDRWRSVRLTVRSITKTSYMHHEPIGILSMCLLYIVIRLQLLSSVGRADNAADILSEYISLRGDLQKEEIAQVGHILFVLTVSSFYNVRELPPTLQLASGCCPATVRKVRASVQQCDSCAIVPGVKRLRARLSDVQMYVAMIKSMQRTDYDVDRCRDRHVDKRAYRPGTISRYNTIVCARISISHTNISAILNAWFRRFR